MRRGSFTEIKCGTRLASRIVVSRRPERCSPAAGEALSTTTPPTAAPYQLIASVPPPLSAVFHQPAKLRHFDLSNHSCERLYRASQFCRAGAALTVEAALIAACAFSKNPVARYEWDRGNSTLTVSTNFARQAATYTVQVSGIGPTGSAPSNGPPSLQLATTTSIQAHRVILSENRTPRQFVS